MTMMEDEMEKEKTKRDKKDKTISMIISTIVCCLPIILTIVLYDRLPEDIPSHYDAKWQPDDYQNKVVAGFIMPVGLALLNLVVRCGIRAEEKYKNAPGVLIAIFDWLIPVISLVFVPYSLLYAIGYQFHIEYVFTMALGILFIIIGNYLPKCRQNAMIGIRIPWTLNNETNWNKTHHLAGYMWILGGLCIIGLSWYGDYAPVATIVFMVVSIGIPILYSFLYSRKGIR